MPIYSYFCKACASPFEEMAKLAEYQDPKPCPTCGASSDRKLDAPGLNFPGDDWTTKNLRIKRQMEQNRARAGKRSLEQKLDGALPSLVPNVQGEETRSWSEAARLAADKGLDPTGYVEKALEKA